MVDEAKIVGRLTREGTLFECMHARIEQCGVDPGSGFSTTGMGTVWIDSAGKLRARIYVAEEIDEKAIWDLERSAPGQLAAESRFYRVSLRDEYGYEWADFRALLQWHISGRRAIASWEPVALTAVEQRMASTSSLRLWSFQDLGIPWSERLDSEVRWSGNTQMSSQRRAVAIASVGGASMEAVQLDEWSQFSVTDFPDGTVLATWPRDFGRAIEFVRRHPVTWNAELLNDGAGARFTIRPRPDPFTRRSHQEPLGSVRYKVEPADFWSLVDRYLRAIKSTEDEEVHPLALAVSALVEASEASWEAQLLTVAVAVESVIDLGFGQLRELPPEDEAALGRIVKTVEDRLAGADIDQKTLHSVRDAVWRGKKRSVNAVLGDLVRAGVVSVAERRAWKKVRGAAAHGSALAHRSPEERISYLGKLYTLFNRLVFQIVGYSGTYVNYGEGGYPRQHFDSNTIDGYGW